MRQGLKRNNLLVQDSLLNTQEQIKQESHRQYKDEYG